MKKDSISLLDFFIIGVPKSGTTSLYEYLKLHPEIYLPEQKELHFFTSKKLLENINGPGDKEALSTIISNYEEYVKLYNQSQDHQLNGDVSPSYFYFIDEFIRNLKNTKTNNVKIIICLRDPINRLVSNYKHKRRLVLEDLDLFSAINQEEKRKANGYGDFWRYKDHSLYANKLKKALDFFGDENIKVILFEDLKADAEKTCKDIFTFLRVDNTFVIENTSQIFNKGGSYKRNIITRFLLKPTRTKTILYNRIPSVFVRSYKYFKAYITRKYTQETESLTTEAREFLVKFFKKDVNSLKYDFEININKWQKYD